MSDREHRLTTEELNEIIHEAVQEAVEETFTRLGLDARNPLVMQRDFQFLRQWRESTETVRKRGLAALIGVLLTGIGGIIWMGIRTWISSHVGGPQEPTLP